MLSVISVSLWGLWGWALPVPLSSRRTAWTLCGRSDPFASSWLPAGASSRPSPPGGRRLSSTAGRHRLSESVAPSSPEEERRRKRHRRLWCPQQSIAPPYQPHGSEQSEKVAAYSRKMCYLFSSSRLTSVLNHQRVFSLKMRIKKMYLFKNKKTKIKNKKKP